MASPLVNIYRWQCGNHAGLKSLRVIIPGDVDTLPESFAVPNIEGDITLKPGAEMYEVEFDVASSRARETLDAGNRNGDYYRREVSFTVRRLRVNVADFRTKLLNRRVHLFFTDNNDETYLYTFVRLRAAEADTAQRGGRNQTSFTFRGASDMPAPFVNGSLIDDPNGQDDKVLVRGTNGVIYCLAVGPCGELITIPVDEPDPGVDVIIGDWVVYTEDQGELNTTPGG